ncbi:MAG: L-threonylcarbamoyladenylate synthase [Ehrlichia sp.]
MISKVIQSLKNGQLVCFPTETVYALAGDAYSVKAIQEIYKIKGRSYNKPLSLLVGNIDKIKQFSSISEQTAKIIQKLSPGPITFVLPINNHNKLSKQFFDSTIGMRIPNHPVALEILHNFGNPIVGTSVNISGQPNVISSHKIPESIKRNISAVIEDDRLVNGTESTVVDLTSYKILRAGAITEHEIFDIIKSVIG